MISRLTIYFLTGLSFITFSSSLIGTEGVEASASIHAEFDAILRDHVSEGVVDYRELKVNEGSLDSYLSVLESINPSILDRNGRLAFWINAYNAYTLKLILNHYPRIESIKDIPSSKRWKARQWSVDGKLYSLDDIEHKILRKMNEPRIHFAIVCASYSCPDLRNEAYDAGRLDEQLEDATRNFLNNSDKGLLISEEEGVIWGTNYTLYLSAIFRWFGEDFEAAAGSVVDYIVPYVSDDTRDFILSHRDELKVKHLDYDWNLNGR
jgi:hypothetical protein